ncbi:hypothetical protein JMJ78_0000969 [Colletotrichum scovillei]|nr:hypothetical protein JMJ78_0000969 [Colletotrichum scovillei]
MPGALLRCTFVVASIRSYPANAVSELLPQLGND